MTQIYGKCEFCETDDESVCLECDKFPMKETGKKPTRAEVTLLRGKIRAHEYFYRVESMPIITDFEFDMLYNKLRDIEKIYPEFIDPQSPTQLVSSGLGETVSDEIHKEVMILRTKSSKDPYSYIRFELKISDILQKEIEEYER